MTKKVSDFLGVKGQGQIYLESVLGLIERTVLSFLMELVHFYTMLVTGV